MLANVIKSEAAIQVSVKIIELFVQIREMLVLNSDLRLEMEKIKKKLNNHDKNIELVFQYLDKFMDKKQKPRKQIGYKN